MEAAAGCHPYHWDAPAVALGSRLGARRIALHVEAANGGGLLLLLQPKTSWRMDVSLSVCQ
jgi:glutamate/tyrosine decarboxylase-like PLP-dependent enzyme